MLEYFCKQSRESLDYTIDFSRFLVGREYINLSSAVITAPVVNDAAATLVITRVGYTKNQVAIWLAGGEDGVQYTVTVTIGTDQGRQKEQQFLVKTAGAGVAVPIVDIADTTATIGYQQNALPMGAGASLSRFTVTLSTASVEPVSIDWSTSDGTAQADIDYPLTTGTVIFAPGETSKTLDVFVYGRTVGNEDRSFFVELMPPANAILGDAQGECVIQVNTSGTLPVTQLIVPTGPRGYDGKSAYQVWLDLGNTGTEQDFIDSLSPSPEDIAEEVAPLLNVGSAPVTSEGTEALSKPDTTTVKGVARRVAYVGATRLATVVLAEGDNLLGQSDMTGDTISFSSGGLYPRIMRGANVIIPTWQIEADGRLLVKGASAGDALFLCQYDFLSDKKTNTNERELWRRTLAEAGLTLADGSFEEGATAANATSAVWHRGAGKCYTWGGTLPKTVAEMTTPGGTGGVSAGAWIPAKLDTLRADLASDGADIVGHNGLPVARYIGHEVTCRPAGNPAGDLAALQAAIATGMEVKLLKGDTFTLDNSIGPAITITQDDVTISGLGRIKATHDTNDLILSTGKRFNLGTGVILEGPGTWRPDLGGTGSPPALVKCMGEDGFVEGCLLIEPYTAGIFVNQAAGCKQIKNTILCSYSGSVALPFIFGIYLRVASDVTTFMNTIDGCIQGICGGGDGSGALTVTCKDGTVTSKLRGVTAQMNTCVNQLDHSIYFSNNTEDISVLNNKGLKSVNDLIKIEGGPNQVIGNTGKGGSAITGRNVFKTRISGNIMTTTLSSEFAYGILLYEQQFKRPLFDVEIDHNQLTHEGAVSKAAVFVMGEVWADQSYQSAIDTLNIHHNTAKGYGNSPEGFQYGVGQRLFATNPVTGVFGTGVHVDNNYGEFPAHTNTTYGIDLGFALKGGSAKDNHIVGFRSVGIRKLGVQDFITTGNILEVADGVTALGGIYERPKDTALHANSSNNTYAENTVIGNVSRKIWISDETCINNDRIIIRRTGGLSSDTVIASQHPKQVIYNNHSNGAVITIDALTAQPWPKDSDLTITNAGASNSLTVNPGAYSVAAGTSLRLVCTGSNAWIKAN